MENQKFITWDTNLAAYLMCNGAEYFDSRMDENKCVFEFSKDEKTIELFNKFKNDSWLKNYNESKKYCLKTMRELRNSYKEQV